MRVASDGMLHEISQLLLLLLQNKLPLLLQEALLQ